MKSGGAFYQTTRMSLTHLKFGAESDERNLSWRVTGIPETDRDVNLA
jgi:hypothetical protein